MDEDAKILQRIEREDNAAEEKWIAEHQQSGGDVHGKGVFARMREELKAREEKTEAERIKREEDIANGLMDKDDKGPKSVSIFGQKRMEKWKMEEEMLAAMTPEERKEWRVAMKYGKHMKQIEYLPQMTKACHPFSLLQQRIEINLSLTYKYQRLVA